MKNKSVRGGRHALSSTSVRTKRGIDSKGKQVQRGLPKKPKVNNTEKPQDSQEKAGDIRREGRIQLASYAAHRMSSAFDVTHTVGMLLIGHNVSISWFDRQGAIQSHFFNIYHNLPHFLLLLLTLQRFSLGRWGYAGSVDKFALQVSATHATTSDGNDPPVIASLKVPNKDIFYFQPQGDVIHAGTSLVGRGPWVIGGSKTKVLSNVASLPYHLKEQVHPYVLKLSWPEESRTSEVAILEKVAEKCLKESDIAMFIRGHVPMVETHVDPTFPGSNTGTIRRFLIENYNGSGTRQQRFVVFERLRPLSVLPELQMVQGYIDTFLCHRALWSLGVHHCDISAGNLMWHPRHNVGVMNDFDLSKLTADLNSASGRENTGTLPFMALDLITPDGLNGKIKRRYRHDTEAFAWSLTYICLNYTLDASENIVINTEHPLAGWFSNVHVVTMSKLQLFRPEGQPQWDAINALAYPNAKSLAQDIAGGYVKRYHQQYSVTQNVASSSNWGAMDRDDELSALLDSESNDALRVPQAVPYMELADGIYFRADLKKIRDWLGGQINRDDIRFGDLRTRYFDDTTRRRGMVLLCRD
ncbi:hypothetical protein BJ165DRAFT_627404 [Panaeolus papilionaceus]|nr:hypothetical protein BJ165DRAFT_627404 [Panaeolus papilionaceus]